MKVLIVSANTLPASPSGAAYIAGAALAAGHTVEVFETLFSTDVASDVGEHVQRFEPDVIGISIRLVNGYVVDSQSRDFEFGVRPFDVRSMIKDMVNSIRSVSTARIVLGGPGFNYFGPDWFEYLDLDYGLRGEAEHSFPLLLERLASGGESRTVPGCIYRENGLVHEVPRELVENLDSTALPAYELFDLNQYRQRGIPLAIFSKRGCAFNCTFCPYSSLEGTRYRFKSPARVVEEIEHLQGLGATSVSFCENSFNVPKSHAEAICREIIDRNLDVRWTTGALKPLKLTPAFIELMQSAGCDYVNLAVETASPTMLRSMNRRYSVDDVREALACLSRSGLHYGISLMFGCPGETPETIAETFDVIDAFPVPPDGVWVSLGICLWTEHQTVLEDARRSGQLKDKRELFEGAHYMSPDLPEAYMLKLIDSLGAREGYDVQVNKAFADHRHEEG